VLCLTCTVLLCPTRVSLLLTWLSRARVLSYEHPCQELRTPMSGVTDTPVQSCEHPVRSYVHPRLVLRTSLSGVTYTRVWCFVHPCLVLRTPLSGSLPTSRRMKYWSLGIRHCSVRFIAEPVALSLDILLELSGKERKFLDSISSF